MSHKTNNTNKDQEQVYQCQECGSVWPETTISVRPISKVLYCRSCQGEDVRLVVEERIC